MSGTLSLPDAYERSMKIPAFIQMTAEHQAMTILELEDRVREVELERDTLLVWFRAALRQLHDLTVSMDHRREDEARQREHYNVIIGDLADQNFHLEQQGRASQRGAS